MLKPFSYFTKISNKKKEEEEKRRFFNFRSRSRNLNFLAFSVLYLENLKEYLVACFVCATENIAETEFRFKNLQKKVIEK